MTTFTKDGANSDFLPELGRRLSLLNDQFDESRYDLGPWRGDVAEAFQQYRSPISSSVTRRIIEELALSEDGVVVDLGCGTGHFTRLLADEGVNVVGADINSDMLRQALSLKKQEYRNQLFRYVLSSSSELATLPCFASAVTICRAFFAMPKAQTLKDLDRIVLEGGTIAIIEEPNFFERREHWQQVITELLKKRLPELREYHAPPMRTEDALSQSAFSNWSEVWITDEYTWTVEKALKIVYSTSLSPTRCLSAAETVAFEQECRATLMSLYPSGEFVENRRYQVIFARRPAK